MARGRMIAKTLSTSQRYAQLHATAGKLAEFCQALYPLIVAHCDDSGRQQGDPFTVKHAVCPSSPRPLTDVEKALTALHTVGLITWYEVEGRKYIQVEQFSDHQPGLKNRGNSKIPTLPGNAVVCREMPSEGKGTEGNRTEENRREGNSADALTVLADVARDHDPATPECKVEAVLHLWNELRDGTKLPACRGLTDKRRTHIRARLKDHGLGEVRDVFVKAAASAFCNGANDRGWVLTFDWVMQSADNFLKVSEGRYDDRKPLKATGTDGRGVTGPPPPGKYDGIEEHD